MTGWLIHCGMPKTGTSLLQGVLAASPDLLAAHGLHYAATGRQGIAHHALAADLLASAEAAGPMARALAAEAAALPAPPRLALVSSESLFNLAGAASAPRLAALLEVLDGGEGGGAGGSGGGAQAIIVLREITGFLESMYLQSSRFRPGFGDFETYLAPRVAWLAGLLEGLAWLRDRSGRRIAMLPAGPGYDVLDLFEQRLALPAGALAAAAAGLRSTARPGLKGQAALANLPWVEEQLGFALAPRRLLRLLEGGGVFAGDLGRYTLWRPGRRARVGRRMQALMRKRGFAAWADLTEALAPDDRPFRTTGPEALEPADIARLRELRPLIERRDRD